MKSIIGTVVENPWIVVSVLTVFFFFSMMRLAYMQNRRKKAFKAIRSLERDNVLSNVYLRLDGGYGDFCDVKVRKSEGEKWFEALFSEKLIIPSILLLPGDYRVQFFVKVRSEASPYYSRKGPFYSNIKVEMFKNTMLVFDNDTLACWQEEFEEENIE